VQEGGFPLAMICRLDPDAADVHPVATAGLAREYSEGIRLSARLETFGQGIIGTAIRDGVTTVSHDIGNDARMSHVA
jgi:hypothetical protein